MLTESFIAEITHESTVTRKVLERVPEDKFGWRPHEKSMTMGRLASHITELIGWIETITKRDDFDLARDYFAFEPKTNSELLDLFDKNLQLAISALKSISEEEMMKSWTLRRGEHLILSLPRAQVIRSVVLNHMIHHRGQLSVYLRLNNIPVPSIYGPSADEL